VRESSGVGYSAAAPSRGVERYKKTNGGQANALPAMPTRCYPELPDAGGGLHGR